MMQSNYNPDVLSCLANLSNDEVFTPPTMANRILDSLPKELWSNKDAKFLDPVSKSGVFLREITKRLIVGLEKQIPNKQERINHIFRNQVYGIAITELTSLLSRRSLYCSKTSNGNYSVCDIFKNEFGNILYKRTKHDWKDGKCTYCGANKEVYDREEGLESYAYEFIHTHEPQKLFKNMKFDVIIGNPPYQLSDGGHSRSASPIYQKFVEQAKKLNPRYLTMIIPSRWFAGGKGLDDFRTEMLNDKRLRKIIDFENSNEVFPGVDVAGGICYFLWDRDNEGLCEFSNISNGQEVKAIRKLNEFNILIRQGKAIPIIHKIFKHEKDAKRLSEVVSPSKPFGMRTFYTPKDKGVPCWFIQKIGLKYANKSDMTDEYGLLQKWKLLLPAAPIAGQTDFSKPIGFYSEANTRIAKPGECCTESWIVAGAFSTKAEVVSYKSYLFTKIARFLLLQTVISQHVTRKNFYFIPDLGKYEGEYSDALLIKKWGITKEEWEFIDSKIKPIEN